MHAQAVHSQKPINCSAAEGPRGVPHGGMGKAEHAAVEYEGGGPASEEGPATGLEAAGEAAFELEEQEAAAGGAAERWR